MVMEKMSRQKCTPTVFYCIHNRIKFIQDVSDFLSALGIIDTKNFFLLFDFFMAEKSTFDFIFLLTCNIHAIQKLGREKNDLCQNSRQELFFCKMVYLY